MAHSSSSPHRVALLPSEPIRAQMAGIGIRYLELARRLPQHGLETVLVTAGDPAEVPEDLRSVGTEIRRFERGKLRELLSDCDVAVSQGQLANDLVLEAPDLPTVIDLYDPFLVENLHYLDTLGLDPYRNDHATWMLQMARGDFFLCSCDEQRQFYLGFLTALGRVHPKRVVWDADLAKLLAVVPFGVPDSLPEHRPYLPPRKDGEKRLLFGGLYDWYDPWPLIDAIEQLDRPGWEVLFIRNPNPDATPQKLFREVEEACRERGLLDKSIRFIDWIPAARRYDLLRDVDLLVSTHRYSLETRLSLRTRFLDALAAGCPVLTSDGGGMSRLLRDHEAGWVVPPEDAGALSDALCEMLEGDPEEVRKRRLGGQRLLQEFHWDRVLEPLIGFCKEPVVDPEKNHFVSHLPTHTPPDSFLFRAERWLRRRLGK